MKRKLTAISDLNIDVLRQILVFVAKSSDGDVSFARAISVCKEFLDLAGEKDVLKAVIFNDTCFSLYDGSFWKIDGLLSKCARAGNKTACHILLRYVKDRLACSRAKLTSLDLAVKDYYEKMRAVKAVCTRARSRAATLAWEEVVCMVHDIRTDSCEISVHLDAMDLGTLAWGT